MKQFRDKWSLLKSLNITSMIHNQFDDDRRSKDKTILITYARIFQFMFLIKVKNIMNIPSNPPFPNIYSGGFLHGLLVGPHF